MVPLAFAALLTLHGLIHLLGAAKAFHWLEVPQLEQPISGAAGLLWLAAAILCLATAVALLVWPRWWWAIGAAALLLSVAAIAGSWQDARAGMAVNALVLAGVAFGVLSQGPGSLRRAFDQDVSARVQSGGAGLVTEADLAHLPGPVRRYLNAAGVVGRPRVRNYRVRMHGRIRSGPERPWMPFTAEQYNVVAPAARLFYLNATMFAVPVQGYHRYLDGEASMLVKAAALVPVARARGPEMTRAETVTLFNDMCLLAPATLVDPAIEWREVDAATVTGRFTNAGHTVEARLVFDGAGQLTNFISDDRSQAAADGSGLRRLRWSTPMRGVRAFGDVLLAADGEARWHETGGEWPYIQLTIDEVAYNVTPP